jgi:two-component system NtrC family sensor kinase
MMHRRLEDSLSAQPWSVPAGVPPLRTHHGQRILVVEDDRGIRDALRTILAGEGYAVSCCDDGRQAFDVLVNTTPAPEVIILDLMLPGMDGWEFRLRQRADPRVAKIPLLVISADGSAKAAAIDADAFLCKPFDLSLLMSEVNRLALDRGEQEHTRALKTVGAVAAGVAHEIKNPLTFVMGNLELAGQVAAQMAGDLVLARRLSLPLSTPAGDAFMSRLGDLESNIHESLDGLDRISSIVMDMGLLGRKPEARHEQIPLRTVVESAIRLAAHHIRGRANLKRDYDDSPVVMASRAQLIDVFLNLLVNACQALPETNRGCNEIRVRILRSGNKAVVEVEDNGVGIAPETAAHVFEPFFTTKPGPEGTGLGLSGSRNIVTALGGTIEFASEPGKGSCFRVILPIASAENPLKS